ncbi:hypothetical protein QCA50_009516 [Cerrena zonata]|uniref:VPS8-like TPR-like repeats domain-containing protein n=1 Tax=Cerrena zonata TaxID=2478898 RepID=A0AAW0G6D3_9APHY
MSPSELQSILVGLADCSDESTREDRQLATEYLLSTYTPHDSQNLIRLFEHAGFYRILRNWHRREHQWVSLLQTYVQDPDLPPSELFPSVEDVIQITSRSNRGILPLEFLAAVEESIPALLQFSISRTALLIDKRIPDLHDQVMEVLAEHPAHDRLLYLQSLLGSPQKLEEEFGDIPRKDGPSTHLPAEHMQDYISLLCEHDQPSVIRELKYLPADRLNWAQVEQTCENNQAYDAVIWSLNHRDEPSAALSKAEEYLQRITNTFSRQISAFQADADSLGRALSTMDNIGTNAVAVCVERSQGNSTYQSQAEDLWFKVLHSQIHSLHVMSLTSTAQTAPEDREEAEIQRGRALEALRAFVQNTFNSLLSVNSSKVVSFPRLFKRLIDSATSDPVSQGAVYNEFRTILSGMLDSYRSDGDLLAITKHMVDCDVYDAVASLTVERVRGWAPSRGICLGCREKLHDDRQVGVTNSTSHSLRIVVSRTGAIYHDRCLPPDFYAIPSVIVH